MYTFLHKIKNQFSIEHSKVVGCTPLMNIFARNHEYLDSKTVDYCFHQLV